ncbi:MAG: hypothetical protein EHM39_12875 [Chloroflexi bacterium]|nr:MAG: hypothetical protein EHM39_12875 [Chloroflexota bacterium]
MSDDDGLLGLIQSHLQRYPASDIMDIYKLLHQATFGPGHLIASKKHAREWLEREAELLTPSAREPLVERIHPEGDIVRIHLRPYLALGGKLKLLLDAFVRSAGQVQGDHDLMARRWSFFVGECHTDGALAGRFDVPGALLFGRIRARENWPAMHHSPGYVAAYKPYYRVLTRGEAVDLCGQLKVPFEIV